MNLHKYQEARSIFHEMLSLPENREPKWQKFFTDYPFVLGSALPLRLMPNEIIPMGRVGKSEPDFIFFQKFGEQITDCGVIELKRPDSRIFTSKRKGIIQLHTDAYTALNQAEEYAELYIRNPKEAIFFGNQIHLFIIMGLSKQLADQTVSYMLYDRLLPKHCRIIPYDQIFRLFESTLPQQVHVLVYDPFLLYPLIRDSKNTTSIHALTFM